MSERKGNMKIVAVTACTVGVAHTFMAAESLEQAAKARGHQIKVETQGAGGIENKITAEDIANADVAIFAVDTNVAERERFKDIPTMEVKTKDAIKRTNDIFNRLEQALKGKTK